MSNEIPLKEATLFQGLTDDQLETIEARGERRTVADGETVFAEGDTGNEVFLLLAGRVQLTLELGHRTEQAPVHTVVPGRIFGDFALFSDVERSATARALQDAVCFAITRQALQSLADEDPRLGYVIMRNLGEILVRRLTKTTRELRASLMF